MNVYVCEFKGDYCGGLVVVAANSADEAYNIMQCDERFEWYFQQVDENGEYYRSRSEWIEETNCYHRKDFRLLKGVTADVKTPQILAENHHEE